MTRMVGMIRSGKMLWAVINCKDDHREKFGCGKWEMQKERAVIFAAHHWHYYNYYLSYGGDVLVRGGWKKNPDNGAETTTENYAMAKSLWDAIRESIAEPGDKWDRAIRSLDDIDTAYSDRCDAQ